MLRALGGLLQPLNRERIFRDINAFLLLIFADQIFLDLFIKVVAAEMRVAAGRANLHRLLFVSAS